MGSKIIQEELTAFTGGLNTEARPDLIDKTQLQESINYENLGDGNLTKRRDAETYDSALNTLLDSTFANEVIGLSEPFYPPRAVSDQTNDFILLVYGNDSGTYKLYAFYMDGASSWKATQISITDVTYTSSSDLKFAVAENKVIVTDGVNRVHYVTVDEDEALVSGILGFSAPLNKLTMTEIDEFDAQDWETNEDNDYISAPGLVQATYTVVDIYGNESNPAPLSDTRNMQWFKLSTTDPVGEDERWINKIRVSNLSLPENLSSDVKDKVKYFNVYIRTIRYSEGETPETFEYSQQFEIIDKDNTSGTTGNTYTITVASEIGNIASYDNDIAPIADVAAHIGGVTLAGSLQTRTEFPFNFDYFVPITINNVNATTFVDAIVRIRLWDANSGETDAITNLVWADYDAGPDDQIDAGHIDRLRLYDQDLTTPLNVVYDMDTSENWVDVYIKIPQLPTSQSYTIYFCFGTTAAGVDNADLQSFAYGEWFSLDNDTWANQEVFHDLLVKENDTFLSFRAEIEATEVYNFADTNYNGAFAGDSEYIETPIARIAEFGETIGEQAFRFTTESAGNEVNFGSLGLENASFFPSGYLCGYMHYNGTNFPTAAADFGFFTINKDGNNNFTLGLKKDGTDFHLTVNYKESTTDYAFDFTDLVVGTTIGTDYYYFICLSWDQEAGEMSAFLWDLDGNVIERDTATNTFNEITWDSATEVYFFCGATGIPYASYDNWELSLGQYLDAGSALTENRIYQLANLSPFFETELGYKYRESDVIVNGTFATDSDWTKGTGWSIGGGTASCDGTQTAVTDLTAAVDPLEDGQYCLVKFTVSGYTAGNVYFICGASTNGTFRSANGTYTERVLADGAGFKIRGDADFVGDIDNVEVYPDSHNNNITFGTVETDEYTTRKNALRWTVPGGNAFSELRDREVTEPIKALLDAPSFLQFEYQNTALIYTRNTITRMILSGDANEWATNPSSLIKEKTGYGLWAVESLAKYGEMLLWLSETGVVQWTPQGLALVSHKIIDIPSAISDPDNIIGFICPVRNQYLLHDKGA